MIYSISDNIDKNIFRGYDIRGIYGEQITENDAYTIGLAFGSYIKQNNYSKCIVGHDNRLSSKGLSDALIKGITSSGIDVKFLGLCSTPMYYFAQKYLNIAPGVMITASHNPKEYNGFKIAFDDRGNACGEIIIDFRNFVNEKVFTKGEGKISYYDITKDYLNEIKKSISLGNRKVKVVVDSANAATTVIVREVFSMFSDKLDVTYINLENDGTFPNHHPDPAVYENNKQLINKVLEVKADLGIGIDGDGDRLGIIDELGNMIYTDIYGIAIVRDLLDKLEDKRVLYDVKCSKALSDAILEKNGTPIMYRTGNSYMKRRMKEENIKFGLELSGHIFFNDKWPNLDDGIYASLRLIEILTNNNLTVSEITKDKDKYFTLEEVKISCLDENKFKLVDKVMEYAKNKKYNIIDEDGVRCEFSDGWALVRASNTAPHVLMRAEALNEKRLLELKEEFLEVINKNI